MKTGSPPPIFFLPISPVIPSLEERLLVTGKPPYFFPRTPLEKMAFLPFRGSQAGGMPHSQSFFEVYPTLGSLIPVAGVCHASFVFNALTLQESPRWTWSFPREVLPVAGT